MALTVGTLWASGWPVHRIGWPLRCGRLRSASALPAFVACGELVGLAQGERNEVEWKALGGSNSSDGRNAVGVWLAGPSDRLASAGAVACDLHPLFRPSSPAGNWSD